MKLELQCPLYASWTPQYVCLYLNSVEPGTPFSMKLAGEPHPFQYTGREDRRGAEIITKLGFSEGEKIVLAFEKTGASTTDLSELAVPLDATTKIGHEAGALQVGEAFPFASFAGRPMEGRIDCSRERISTKLVQFGDGPLFKDYRLTYDYGEGHVYELNFRCYKQESWIEVCETFSLGLDAELVWTLNPERHFTHIISRDSFEGENQPSVEPLGAERPRDVLCRLQMPVLTEYFIPNNRGWFSFFDAREEAAGMVGILGLYGARWEEPVVNMPEVFDREGAVEWHASLCSGRRHWLLYAGPVEKTYTVKPVGEGAEFDGRFVFHRLHAEFNGLRLDEHLDLGTEAVYDAGCADAPGVFAAGDFHAAAGERLAAYPCLEKVFPLAEGEHNPGSFQYLLEPTKAEGDRLYRNLIQRFELWVRQFQGYRTGINDYAKNVIGFSRSLRGMLLTYEQLRRDGTIDAGQIRRLNAHFAFAARRILDEGRWPHSRTWKHPDHPESSRDFYTYGGEHKPDRLVWTNCLPNFQSDPMCVLAHLSAIFKEHPDANFWLRFSLEDIDRQLDAYCGKSGAWQESINYALYTFSYLIITFKAVKSRWGIDYFNDERVRRFASWLCRFAGPVDKRFGVHTMPGVGNAVLPQLGADYLLCYAAELAEEDPLRADCLAIWKKGESYARPREHFPVTMAAMAPLDPAVATASASQGPFESECMDEVGVALRDRYGKEDESYLFQKIGFAKDHYETDESAFNWYAKGTPFCMDYGTYTGDVGPGGAHNLVEIPDMDALRRGYLADHLFTGSLDYTRCEIPVTLKLLWGKIRSFEEVEQGDGKVHRDFTPYYYIGDKNPVGPKLWKVRMMLFIKPDYTVIFDRVFGRVPHRYNLHFTGKDIEREGATITAKGRFDLDLLTYVQHPADFRMETGELIPKIHKVADDAMAERQKHAQHYFRLYNEEDGIYRTLLFARERDRDVRIEPLGKEGIQVTTPEYTDHVYISDTTMEEAGFTGRAGWIRRYADGRIEACVPDGERIEAFGVRVEGRGPWTYGLEAAGKASSLGPTPRPVAVTEVTD